MTKDEALKLALKFVEDSEGGTADLEAHIKEALAQPEQHQDWCASLTQMLMSMPPKPAPCNCKPKPEQPKVRTGNCLRVGVCASEGHKIAPQRTWVGLTNYEVNNLAAGCHLGNSVQGVIYKAEAKLKEKNNV